MEFQLLLGEKADALRPAATAPVPEAQPDEPAPREALRAFGRAATQEPAEPDYDFMVGTALLRAGDPARAAGRLADAVRLDRSNPDYAFALGCAYWHLGRLEEAEATFREGAGRWPDDLATRNAHGAALVRLGRSAEAVDVFEAILGSAPRSVEAHANLGVALWNLGRKEEAVARWRRAARLGDWRPEPLRNLGLGLRDLGRADEAFTVLRRAAALAPGGIEPLLDLGEAAFEAGRVAEAEAAFADAVRLDPRSVASRPSSLAARDALRRQRVVEPTHARPALEPLGLVLSAIAHAEAAIRRLPRSKRLGGPLFLGAALLAATAALRVLPPYVDHYLLRDDLAAVARASVEDDFQVRDRLAHAIRERGLEGVVEADRCEVHTRTAWRRITCAYVVPLEILPGLPPRRLSFRVDVEQPYVLPRGGS
ncbi:MAG TPA: tetratricopeptide repeat protein [Vicinamibacteria bacterium]